MSKFLSGRQSNLKLGVAGYTESKTVLETTGKVGIGTTDAQQHSLFVVGSTNITGDTTVGSAITMYASSGIVSATAFYGDGSNLENTGATLSAAAGTQRLVVTSLTSGTMVDAATDSDLTYNATTDTLNVENIDVDGHTELDQLRVTGVSTFAGNVDISSNGNLTVAGNLIVQGTETRLNTTVLEVEDINIGIASVTPTLSDAALDGAGITIHGSQGDKTLTWSNANSRMEFNTDVNVANLELDDNQKAKFGTGEDLQIYHDGNVSYIRDVGTGSLLITTNGPQIRLRNGTEGEDMANFIRNGAVELFYDDSKKFETTDGGIDVTGHTETDTLRVSGVSTFQNNVSIDGTGVLDFDNNLSLWWNNYGVIQNNTGRFDINQYAANGNLNLWSYKTSAFLGIRVEGSTGEAQLYHLGNKKLNTTGIGVSIYDTLNVGTGVTIYGNAGIVSATSFFGDGSNLTNTGATLSATSGVERLVTTQLTSGTMVDAATDADLTFDAGNNTLNTQNIQISGGISTNGSSYGQSQQILRSTGSGWEWADVPGLFSVNNILNGINVLEEGSTVGTAGSITTLDFRGINVTATADPQPNGIATITFSTTPTFTDLTVLNDTTLGGAVSAGGTTGTDGQYLKSTGIGVTWASFPTLRTTQTTSASANQTVFNFTYNVNFLDVFVNGVKLTSSEYTANNGSQITLNTPAFASDIVEFHSYNTVSTGGGGGGGGGSSNLVGLSDVNFPISLADNQLLQYNSSTSVWENVAVTSLPYATEAFVGLATAGLASEAFVGLATAGLASETLVGTSTAGLASEAFVGLATAGLLSSTGDASNLTNLTGAAAATYGNGTAVPQITVDANGRITGITNVSISAGGGGGGASIFIRDSGSLVGSAGTIDFGTGLSVSTLSAGIVTVTSGINTAIINADTINSGTLNVSGVSTLGVTTATDFLTSQFKSVGYSTFTSRVIFDEILEFRGLEAGGSNSLDFYNAGGVLQHSITYDSNDFNIGGGSIVEIDATDSVIVSNSGVGIATFTQNGLNVSGVVTATSFEGDGSGLTGIGTVAIGDNAPGSPNVGDLWWESDTATGHIYYNDGSTSQWVQFNSGSSGSGSSSGVGTSRFTVSNTTGSIGAGTTTDITISGAKAYSLFKIETSHAAWVRLYTDTTSRTSDASRAYTTDPTPGSGVLAEVYTTTSGSNTFKMTPAVTGWNDDGTPSTNIYAKVTNNESTSQDITVTLTILRMED